ncbi:hypothetical protein BU17DRAFT_65623 [Hysterangium stoloniferum]|nr:hypothetical protein BU17DRAFT_65623 [Hysterangium stoloniferum]
MFLFTRLSSNAKLNSNMDVEMGYAGEVDNALPGNSEGHQEINVEQNIGNAGLIAQPLVQPSHATLTVSPTYLPALSQPSEEAISSAPQNMSLFIAGYNVESNRLPSKHQRLESAPIENNKSSQVVAAQKVRLVMQNDWQDRQQHEKFEQMKKSVAWQSKTLKELQAQLNDFKKHAENAEKVGEEATGQATEVEQQSSAILKPIPPTSSKGSTRKLPPPPPSIGNRQKSGTQPGQGNTQQSYLNMSVEEKLNIILESLQKAPRMVPRHRARSSGFKDPVAWVRNHMHSLIGIRTTNEILLFKDELYAIDTELQKEMALYEDHKKDEGPQLKQMRINWKVVNGRWNKELFLQFLSYAEEQGYAEGCIQDADEDELRDMFYARINRMVGAIHLNQPKPKEGPQQTEKRIQGRHKEMLEFLIEELNDESKAWIDNHMIVDNLGVEGQSSDETDEDSDGVYTVKRLNWRNRELIKRLNGVDAVRRTTNKYGNRRPGTAPRTCKRNSARDSHPTARAPPTGKPINFYSEDCMTIHYNIPRLTIIGSAPPDNCMTHFHRSGAIQATYLGLALYAVLQRRQSLNLSNMPMLKVFFSQRQDSIFLLV